MSALGQKRTCAVHNVKAEGLALFRDRAIVANFIFMGDTVRSGLGARGEAAIIKRKVYANVA